MIFVDLKNKNKLLINTINGKMSEINIEVYDILKQWQTCKEILPKNNSEVELFDFLVAEGYVVKSDSEEEDAKNEILSILRNAYKEAKEQCEKITLVMTYDCNFDCYYCFEAKAKGKNAVIQPNQIDIALKLANNNPEYIGLFGGEPLLPKTRNSIEYLFSVMPDKIYDIITNGYYLEEFMDLLSTVKIEKIMVTLDGEENTHNQNRHLKNGQPTYKKILSGIEKCLKNNIPIQIRMNSNKDNIDASFKLQKDLFEMFVDYKENLQIQITPLMQIPDEDKNELIKDIHKEDFAHSEKGNKFLDKIPLTSNPIINSIALDKPMLPLYAFCSANKNELVVDPYGNIFSCLVGVGNDKLAIGQYQPTIEFKENSIYNRNIESITECRECIYSLVCGGGCAMRLPSKQDMLKPACSSTLTQIYDLLPKIYELMQEESNV